MVKVDIDFNKELWDTVSRFREALSKNEYKNYILSLAFLMLIRESSWKYFKDNTEQNDSFYFEGKMEVLKAQFMQQFEKSNELQFKITRNLNKV